MAEGYSQGKQDDPVDSHDRLTRVGSKYQATAPAVANLDNVYLLVDAAGRLLIAGSVAHDDVDAGNPVAIGGIARAALPTAVAAADRVKAMFDVYGRLVVIPYVAGASEVKTARKATATDSTTRVTALTPTAGKKVRIIAILLVSEATASNFEVYFGTGTNIGTNAGKEIAYFRLATAVAGLLPNSQLIFPDSAGPIGAADDVVSLRTSVDIAANGTLIIVYREE